LENGCAAEDCRPPEEIVSGVLVVFEFFHFMWALLMEVDGVCFKTFIYCEQLCNNAVNYPSTPFNAHLMLSIAKLRLREV
jgi:hypothetical protein